MAWIAKSGGDPALLIFDGSTFRLGKTAPKAIDTLMRRFSADERVQKAVRRARINGANFASRQKSRQAITQADPAVTARIMRLIEAGVLTPSTANRSLSSLEASLSKAAPVGADRGTRNGIPRPDSDDHVSAEQSPLALDRPDRSAASRRSANSGEVDIHKLPATGLVGEGAPRPSASSSSPVDEFRRKAAPDGPMRRLAGDSKLRMGPEDEQRLASLLKGPASHAASGMSHITTPPGQLQAAQVTPAPAVPSAGKGIAAQASLIPEVAEPAMPKGPSTGGAAQVQRNQRGNER